MLGYWPGISNIKPIKPLDVVSFPRITNKFIVLPAFSDSPSFLSIFQDRSRLGIKKKPPEKVVNGHPKENEATNHHPTLKPILPKAPLKCFPRMFPPYS